MVNKKLFILVVLFLTMVSALHAGFVTLGNRYIEVWVHDDTGRFIIKTINGDPGNKNDDYKYLTTKDSPPTSYTTIAMDDGSDIYKFGSDDGDFVKKPYRHGKKVITIWEVDKVQITQTITIVKGKTTQREDSIKIRYDILNKSGDEKKVGVRIMMDTAIGDSSDFPFTVSGYGIIKNERELRNGTMAKFFYCYDNAKKPKIQTVWSLFSPGLMSPDRIIFANWRKLSENAWKYSVDKGASFKRSLFGSPDSAVALYFETRRIRPSQSLNIGISYGIHGAKTIVGQKWGVTIDSEQEVLESRTFSISADIKNLSKIELENCVIKLIIPAQLTLSGVKKADQAKYLIRKFKKIKPGERNRMTWIMLTKTGILGDFEYQININGSYKGIIYSASTKKKVSVVKFKKKTIVKNVIKKGPTDINLTRINKIVTELNLADKLTQNHMNALNRIIKQLMEGKNDNLYSMQQFKHDWQQIEQYLKLFDKIDKRITK